MACLRSTRAIIATITVMVALAGMPSEASACTLPDDFARLASPEAEIGYRLLPEQIAVGRFFEAEVIACRTPGADGVREILFDAQMPAHGHGMNYRPTSIEVAPGRFRISGMMLHMPGRWRLSFDVVLEGRRMRLTREIDLER